MINQRLISLKIYYDLLEELDTEVFVSSSKRNWIINRAIKTYLELQDSRRLYNSVGSERNKKEVLNSYLRQWFPEAATW